MPVKPLAGLSRTLRGLLVANIVASVLSLLAALYSYVEYAALPEGTDYAEVLLPSDAIVLLVYWPAFGLFVAVGVVFLMWVYRANKNLRALSGTTLRFTPGWSVAWFFIPILCVVRPYQVVKEIWLVSHRRREPLLIGQAATGEGAGLVGLWWASFLLSTVVGQVVSRLSYDVVDVQTHLTALAGDAVTSAVDAVGYVVTLVLVVRLTAAYAANIDERALQAAPGGSGSAWPAGEWGAWPAGQASAAWPACGAAPAGVAAVGGAPPLAGPRSTAAGRVDAAAGATGVTGGAARPVPASAAPRELPPPAWHPDPTRRHELRWWDGGEWTEFVGDGGVMSEDPV